MKISNLKSEILLFTMALLASIAPARADDPKPDLESQEQKALAAAADRVAPCVVRIETIGGLERAKIRRLPKGAQIIFCAIELGAQDAGADEGRPGQIAAGEVETLQHVAVERASGEVAEPQVAFLPQPGGGYEIDHRLRWRLLDLLDSGFEFGAR